MYNDDKTQCVKYPVFKEEEVFCNREILKKQHFPKDPMDEDVQTDEEMLNGGIQQSKNSLKMLKKATRSKKLYRRVAEKT